VKITAMLGPDKFLPVSIKLKKILTSKVYIGTAKA
jgi:hypothetical protein